MPWINGPELIQGSDTLNAGRIKINDAFSGQTNIWSSGTGSYSVILNNNGNNNSTGNYSFVLGRNNTAVGDYTTILGGAYNTASGLRSNIMGGFKNRSISFGSAVVNGYANMASSNYSIVVGGHSNSAITQFATITGGKYNVASGARSFIGGGWYNTVGGTYGIVSGGGRNRAGSSFSFVGGGYKNSATTGNNAVVSGGLNNLSNSYASFVGGGGHNSASTYFSSVTGGRYNIIGSSGKYSFIGGGGGKYASVITSNIISASTAAGRSFIGAGSNNIITGIYSFIGAGGGHYGASSLGNSILSSTASAIVAGRSNTITNSHSFIGAGQSNSVSGTLSTIGGGKSNVASGTYSSVVGGRGNQAANTSSVAMGGGSKTRSSFDVVIGGTATDTPSVNNNTITLSGGTGDIAMVGTVSNGWADYAEYFEWNDGNPSGEDRVGCFVSIDDGKIFIGNKKIIGVVSATPCVVGDAAELHWDGMYETDEWRRRVFESYTTFEFGNDSGSNTSVFMDKNGNKYSEYPNPSNKDGIAYDGDIPSHAVAGKITAPKINGNFDASKPYVPRSLRKEWSAIGLLGKLYVRTSEDITGKFVDADENGMAVNGSRYTVIKTIKAYGKPYGIVQILFK